MAVVIDEKWLADLGIEASGKSAEELIDLAMDELEMRVGYEIANQLTDEEIAEFEKLEGDEKRIAWLEKALPTYLEIVDEKFEMLTAEVQSANDKPARIRSWAAAH